MPDFTPSENSRPKVRVEVWGPRAIFTNPVLKVERWSYDVITPSAARNLLQAIYWHPNFQYMVTRIECINPILRQSLTRNELEIMPSLPAVEKARKASEERGLLSPISLDASMPRQQRSTSYLTDVHYVIEAEIWPTNIVRRNSEEAFDVAKIRGIFYDRIRTGKCYTSPYLGIREFIAYFGETRYDKPAESFYKGTRVDLGIMLYDIDFYAENGPTPYFFHPYMIDGVIEVPNQKEVMRDAALCAE